MQKLKFINVAETYNTENTRQLKGWTIRFPAHPEQCVLNCRRPLFLKQATKFLLELSSSPVTRDPLWETTGHMQGTTERAPGLPSESTF